MDTDPRPAVLVVDNDPTVRAVLDVMVGRLGYAAVLASGGAEGVEVYDAHRDRVALAVLDVRMPGLDGPQTLATLRERTPTLPCVFLTSGFTSYSMDELTAEGAVVRFKPITLDDLAGAIRAVRRVESREDEGTRTG